MKQYAIVAYVGDAVGRFVEDLRCELHPPHGHLPAHLTILPPRPLRGREAAILESLEDICRTVEPFHVVMGEVATFAPLTPTVFIRVERAAYKLRELHDKLNTEGLGCQEQWPYMPHLTIVKMATEKEAQEALRKAREAWSRYRGPRQVMVDELTFVREGEQHRWIDLATLPLGRTLASQPSR
jgi:2'-5' RNA ligase